MTHYARNLGIPVCANVTKTDESNNRQSRYRNSGTRPVGKRQVVSVQVETATLRANVDCTDCIPFMDADGI